MFLQLAIAAGMCHTIGEQNVITRGSQGDQQHHSSLSSLCFTLKSWEVFTGLCKPKEPWPAGDPYRFGSMLGSKPLSERRVPFQFRSSISLFCMGLDPSFQTGRLECGCDISWSFWVRAWTFGPIKTTGKYLCQDVRMLNRIITHQSSYCTMGWNE